MTGYAQTYGPIQLKRALGWPAWQVDRGLAEGILPGPDFGGSRWTKPVVDGLLARAAELLARLGTVPDCGIWKAATYLAERFGGKPQPEAVVELARQRVLREAGSYKNHVLYSGRDIEAFTDQTAYERACVDGRQWTREKTAEFLRVRPVDVRHLERAGLLRPVASLPGRWGSEVMLFRAGDLAALLTDDRVDWEAVRAIPRGKASPLAELPAAA